MYLLLRSFQVARSTYTYTVTEAYLKRICGEESSRYVTVTSDQTLTMIKTNVPLGGRGSPVSPRAMLHKDAPSVMWNSSQKRPAWDNIR